jgi:hypothetical protein
MLWKSIYLTNTITLFCNSSIIHATKPEKLGSWLEDNTYGQYKIVRKNTGNINKKSA